MHSSFSGTTSENKRGTQTLFVDLLGGKCSSAGLQQENNCGDSRTFLPLIETTNTNLHHCFINTSNLSQQTASAKLCAPNISFRAELPTLISGARVRPLHQATPSGNNGEEEDAFKSSIERTFTCRLQESLTVQQSLAKCCMCPTG